MLPLLPLPARAAYLGPPLAQRLLHPPVIVSFVSFSILQSGMWNWLQLIRRPGAKSQVYVECDEAAGQKALNPGNDVCTAGHNAAVPCPA